MDVQSPQQQTTRAGALKALLNGGREAERDKLDLEAENLYLREELDRARLALRGVHPSNALIEVLQSDPSQYGSPEELADAADAVITARAQTMALQQEMVNVIQLFQKSLNLYERRLQTLIRPIDDSIPD